MRCQLVAAALGLGAALTACGGHLTDAQVRAANAGSVTTITGSTGGTVPSPQPGVVQPSLAGSGAPVAAPQGGSLPSASSQSLAAVASAPGATRAAASGGRTSKAATTSSAAPQAGTPGQTGPIIIGSVGNYSGAPGATLSELPRGLQVWAAAVNNSGGLLGRQVQVIVEDDGGDPSTYGSEVQDLVENKHVVAFVAQGDLLTAQGGSAYLQQHGIPVIGSDCSRSDAGTMAGVYQQCPAPEPFINDMFKIAKKVTGATKVGYVYCLESTSCTEDTKLYDADAQANGMQIVYKASTSITTIDFTSNCQAAQKAGAQLFIVAADPSTLQRFAQSCDRQDFRPQYFSASIAAVSSTNQVDGLEGMLLPSYTFPFAGVTGNPAIDAYTKAMATYLKNDPVGPASSMGWAAAKVFELAATKAASMAHTITPKSLTDALKTIKGETLGGLTVPLDFTTSPASNSGCAFTVKSDPATKKWGAPYGTDLTC